MDDNDLESKAEPSDSADAFDWGEDEVSEGDEPDVLRFDLGGMALAVEAQYVSEVGTSPTITEVPGLPEHILGVAVRRRSVLSMLDLANFLGIEHRDAPTDRLIVFNVDGIEAGAMVSQIKGLEVWPEDAEPPSLGLLDNEITRFIVASRWAPGGRVLLLDITEILRNAAVR